LAFIDGNENVIMAYDDIMSSNLLVVPIEKEELEKTPFNVNVSQRSHK
jgi:hypothetical protein